MTTKAVTPNLSPVHAGMSPLEWLASVRTAIDGRIEAYLASKRPRAEATTPAMRVLVDAIRDLTMREGKRVRPILAVLGYSAIAPVEDLGPMLDAAVAAELLQTGLLIYDDWMDQDSLRRGGPTVHVLLGQRYGDAHVGASTAILAANLACAYAWEALATAAFPPERTCSAFRAFGALQEAVAAGQLLDITGDPSGFEDMYALKTASYTVTGPLHIGALLAGADEAQLDALKRYGQALGIAFQLRDDVLGAIGSPEKTGKPIGSDLRAGKRTALVIEALARMDGAQRAAFDRAFGSPSATPEECAAAHAQFEACGALRAVEDQGRALCEEAIAALDGAHFEPHSREILRVLAGIIAFRVN